MRFPWKWPKRSEQKDESTSSKDYKKEDRPSVEEVSENGSVGFKPEIRTDRELSRFDENRNRLNELLLKYGIPTVIHLDHKVEISEEVKKEISNLIEENKKLMFEPTQEDENIVMKMANFYYFTGDPHESIRLYDTILKKRPNKMSALNNKGVALDSLEVYDDAIKCFDKALSIAPENVHVLSNKGIALYKKGRYDEALACLDSALRFDPKYVIALVFKAHSLFRLGRRRAALDTYETAIKVDPASAEVFYNMACLFSVDGRENDALVSLEKAIKIDSSWKRNASTDEDFQNIRNTAKFRELVG